MINQLMLVRRNKHWLFQETHETHKQTLRVNAEFKLNLLAPELFI